MRSAIVAVLTLLRVSKMRRANSQVHRFFNFGNPWSEPRRHEEYEEQKMADTASLDAKVPMPKRPREPNTKITCIVVGSLDSSSYLELTVPLLHTCLVCLFVSSPHSVAVALYGKF